MRNVHILMQNDTPISAHPSMSTVLEARRQFAKEKSMHQVEGTLFKMNTMNYDPVYLHFIEIPLEDG